MKITALLLTLSLMLSAENILEDIDRKLTPVSAQMYKKLINIEPDGSKKEFLLFQAKKDKDKMISLFLEPESDKGRATLRLGDNMWLYIPNVGKPLRITSMQSVVGGVFNNADIMRLDFSTEYDVTSSKDMKEYLELELKAKNDTVSYDKLIMQVDKKHLTPIQIECYTSTGMLIKTLYYKEPKDFGDNIIRPAVVETESPMYKGYKSVMIYGKISPKEFADEAFTLDSLSKASDLRR
ncbi:outer membrane lipoprotein-sorting protein [Sulfurimonas sp. CVO]|uniref:outer membrane lipoprotein-sorting protein n=1 Tax=Sulfurimonas sp. CVO TaxID=2283483 RepID=UPI000CB0CC51|nr:outer membrane lipoprotein-sorting protein [Sulfurimonas sp. CVO]PLY15448.1 MAG: outer membrane lipoprotein-sorting protein [Sulfurimonas sp.]QHG90921.1 outer membrane lipoprotein-sorting protein [Sulfurimonas sp. CVO]